MQLVRQAAMLAAVVVGGIDKSLGAEIIAHRGASYDAPENTVAAMQLAWEQGADAIETDVRLSRDGQIVAFHDVTTERIGGRRERVSRQTLAELKTLDVGSWKGEEWAGERIPTLAQILETVPPGKRVFVELKVGDEIIPELKRVLEASGLDKDQTVIIGSSLRTMQAVKQAMPERQVYWVATVRRHPETGQWLPSVEGLIGRARDAGIDGLDLAMSAVIDKEYVETVRQAGLGFYVWTVNDADAGRHLVESGVDGITTDRPGWLRKQLRLEEPIEVRTPDVSAPAAEFEVVANDTFWQDSAVAEVVTDLVESKSPDSAESECDAAIPCDNRNGADGLPAGVDRRDGDG